MNMSSEMGANPEVVRLGVERMGAHASLERGEVEPYSRWLASSRDRQDLERPGTRRDAARGYVTALLDARLTAADTIQQLFQLRPEELERANLRERARSAANAKLTAGNFALVGRLWRDGLLDPSFFSQPATVDAARFGVSHAFSRQTQRGRDGADDFIALLGLPLPQELLSWALKEAGRPMIAVAIQYGHPEVPDLMRRVGIDRTNMDEKWGVLASESIRSLLLHDPETAASYARTFGIDLLTYEHTTETGTGYATAVQTGNLQAALAYERAFPSVRQRVPADAIANGLARCWTERTRADADAFLRHFRPDEPTRFRAAEQAARTAITKGNDEAMNFLRDIVRVPNPVIREAANAAVAVGTGDWTRPENRQGDRAFIERARRMARLKWNDLVPGIVDGMAGSYRMLLHELSRRESAAVFDLRPAKAAAAYLDVPERALGIEFVKQHFLRQDLKHNAAVQEAFGLEKTDMDRGAIDAAVHSLTTWEGSGAEGVLSKVLSFVDDPAAARKEPALRAAAMRLVQGEYEKLRPKFANPIIDLMELSETERAEVGRRARAAARQKFVDDLRLFKNDEVGLHEVAHPDEMFPAVGLSWDEFSPKEIPFQCVLSLPSDPKFRALVERDPWRDGLARALKLQGRSANLEHDQWIQEGNPLFQDLVEEGLLDRTSADDGNLIPEYIKTFGLYNIPRAARIYFRLKRGPFAALPEADRQALVELVGPKAARLESEHLINELRKLRTDIQSDIIADKTPRKVDTVLGGEMFKTVRGSSSWEQKDNPSDLFETWKKTVAAARTKEQREGVMVADGYEEVVMRVPKARRAPQEDEGTRRERKREVLEDPAYVEWSDRIALAKDRSTTIEKNGVSEPGVPRLDAATVRELSFVVDPEDKRFVAYMEQVASLPETDEKQSLLLALSLLHVQQLDADWSDAILSEPEPGRETGALREVAEFLRQYLSEHYLNPRQERSHTKHLAFSETLRSALLRAWGLENGVEGHAVVKTAKRLAALEPKQEYSKEAMEITLVPVQGAGRLYAGEIGDACYSSQHQGLAEGLYPRVKGLLFVTNRNKPKERLNGSALFIETRTDPEEYGRDERVIVIRANNPRQNLVAQVDARELVGQTVAAAIETARRRKIKHVGVVLDEASMASSNREAISEAYAEAFGWSEKTFLVNEPETNFNDYPIWDADGSSPTVIVWTNDDPEAT